MKKSFAVLVALLLCLSGAAVPARADTALPGTRTFALAPEAGAAVLRSIGVQADPAAPAFPPCLFLRALPVSAPPRSTTAPR